jgi:sensor domain CHASE-containing protein
LALLLLVATKHQKSMQALLLHNVVAQTVILHLAQSAPLQVQQNAHSQLLKQNQLLLAMQQKAVAPVLLKQNQLPLAMQQKAVPQALLKQNQLPLVNLVAARARSNFYVH